MTFANMPQITGVRPISGCIRAYVTQALEYPNHHINHNNKGLAGQCLLTSYQMARISLTCSATPDLAQLVDQARGDMSRNAWLLSVISEAVGAPSPGGTGAGGRDQASAVGGTQDGPSPQFPPAYPLIGSAVVAGSHRQAEIASCVAHRVGGGLESRDMGAAVVERLRGCGVVSRMAVMRDLGIGEDELFGIELALDGLDLVDRSVEGLSLR